MRVIIFFILITVFNSLHSQDTVQIGNRDFKLFLNLSFKQLYQNTPFKFDKIIDPVVNINRPIDTMPFYTPFMHNSSYFKLGTEIRYKNKYSITFSSFFEQRNWSEAKYNNDFIFIFPEFKLKFHDTLIFINNDLIWNIKIGDLYNNDEMEYGFRAYNIDIQGLEGNFSIRKNNFNLIYATDLAQNFGLLINEYIYASYFYKTKTTNNISIKSGISTSIMNRVINRDSHLLINEISLGCFTKIQMNEKLSFSINTDYIFETNNNKFDIGNSAATLKLNYIESKPNFKFEITPKIRFYGLSYFKNNYENSFYLYKYRYRHERRPYSEGQIMYPLKNYFRPVSQFAFYSEYPDIGNLLSFELDLDLNYKIFKNLYHKLNIETISILRNDLSSNSKKFTYFYYTSNLYLKLFKGFTVGLYVSNKQMNRDVHYMTYYQMKYPFFGIHLTFDANFELKN